MAVDWIHCNKCFLRYQTNVKFFLTECGHLNCQMCAKKMEQSGKKCLVCGYVGATLLLSNDIKPDLQQFFTNPLPAFDKMKQVVDFQINNYSSLLKNVMGKYLFAKNELAKFYKQNKELKKENEKLRELLNSGGRYGPSLPPIRGPICRSSQIPGTTSPSLGSQLSSVNSKATGFFRPQFRQSGTHPGYAQRILTPQGKGSIKSQISIPQTNDPSPVQMVSHSVHSSTHSGTNSAMSSFSKLIKRNNYH